MLLDALGRMISHLGGCLVSVWSEYGSMIGQTQLKSLVLGRYQESQNVRCGSSSTADVDEAPKTTDNRGVLHCTKKAYLYRSHHKAWVQEIPSLGLSAPRLRFQNSTVLRGGVVVGFAVEIREEKQVDRLDPVLHVQILSLRPRDETTPRLNSWPKLF